MKWTTANIPPQTGKLAIVTGANSGIGWYTALELARAGSEVILTVRSEAKGQDAVARIRQQLPQSKVRYEILDLASLASVREFAAKVNAEPKLDLLINNAGVMNIPRRVLTPDGFERQFGTNFLGHFALTGLLMPALLNASAPRVTTVSSGAANLGLKRIKFEDLQWEHGYKPWTVYCQSKLADLMLALELSRRCVEKKIPLLSNAAHPGFTVTNLQTSGPGKPMNLPEKILAGFASHDVFHGALPTIRAATDPTAAPGSYYSPHRFFQLKGDPVLIGIPKPAQDQAAAKKLWDIAESLTGVTFPA
jgi:NAD(P)-dependent dehydrogenase (short-subunit alcohol dehydrogenase family)